MQIFRLGTFTAVLLLSLSSGGCNKDKNKDADSDGPVGDPCQAYSAENGGKYLCPEGYFCKYDIEADMLNPNEIGRCEVMEQYKECMNITLCGSNYSPRCETINETAYCDSFQTSKRCRCDKPGPFTPIEGEADGGEVKTPTTTK